MSRRKQPGHGTRVLVATVLLVAIGALFAALCAQLIGGHRADLRRLSTERQAVPYVKAIGQLAANLVEARSAAIGGQADPSGNLRISVTTVSDLDGQLGAALLTTERWAELKAAIDLVLADRPTGVAAADRYADLVTMAIDLMDAVATASMLHADPEPTTRALTVAARELVNLSAATARAADASALAAMAGRGSETDSEEDTRDGAGDDARPDSDATADGQVDLAVALHDAAEAYRTLVTALTASLDAGPRAPFTSTVTEQLDLIHTALDPSVRPAALRASSSADPATLNEVARQVRGVVNPFTHTVLDELDGRLVDREAALRGQLLRAVGLAAAGFVLGLVVLWWSAAPPLTSPEQATDDLVDGPDVASVSVQLPAVDARELLALEELVHVGRGVRGRPPGGDDDAE